MYVFDVVKVAPSVEKETLVRSFRQHPSIKRVTTQMTFTRSLLAKEAKRKKRSGSDGRHSGSQENSRSDSRYSSSQENSRSDSRYSGSQKNSGSVHHARDQFSDNNLKVSANDGTRKAQKDKNEIKKRSIKLKKRKSHQDHEKTASNNQNRVRATANKAPSLQHKHDKKVGDKQNNQRSSANDEQSNERSSANDAPSLERKLDKIGLESRPFSQPTSSFSDDEITRWYSSRRLNTKTLNASAAGGNSRRLLRAANGPKQITKGE